MTNRHMDETLNMRRFYLRLVRRLPVWCAFVICGAVAGLALYVLATTVFGPGRLYRAESKLYLQYAEGMSSDAYPYYNDYTWNDLITTDEILDGIMEDLAAAGFREVEVSDANDMGVRLISRGEVAETIEARLPSDVRLMVISFTNHDPVVANAVMEATSLSLQKFAAAHREFEAIEVRSQSVAAIVTYPDRRLTAALAGAVLSGIAGFFFLLIKEILDDACVCPEELPKRFSLPAATFLCKEFQAQTPLYAMAQNDFRRFVRDMGEAGITTLHLIVPEETGHPVLADEYANRLEKLLDATEVSVQPSAAEEDALYALPAGEGVLVAVRAGVQKLSLTEHALLRMKQGGVPVKGMVLADADAGFLRRYYGLKAENGEETRGA